jgi:hypothetical protein
MLKIIYIINHQSPLKTFVKLNMYCIVIDEFEELKMTGMFVTLLLLLL